MPPKGEAEGRIDTDESANASQARRRAAREDVNNR